MCVACYSTDHGRVIWHGHGWYWYEYEDDEWLSGDDFGLADYLARSGAMKVVLRGRTVAPARFSEIYGRANVDPRLPPRSSYSPLEEPAP